ncbi:MAG TPA: hypothetical protein VEL80_08820 [Burkholderiales bacterium]|nr:hypothetical protein [Burkholderiales bacterium]
MWYQITLKKDYLKADLFDRDTAAETQKFLVAVEAAARKHQRWQILISVHASRAIFKVEQYGISDYFKQLAGISKYRIALTADSEELRVSQQYIESLARQHAINVRSFRNEREALYWFTDRRWPPDRRQRQGSSAGPERRQGERRLNPSLREPVSAVNA